jgi:hypothetical protein
MAGPISGSWMRLLDRWFSRPRHRTSQRTRIGTAERAIDPCARLDRTEDALDRAVARGRTDAGYLASAPDLASLQEHPRWVAVLASSGADG